MARKMNYLTRESQKEWAKADQRSIELTKERKRQDIRAEQWARWKAEQTGIAIPTETKMTVCYGYCAQLEGFYGEMAEFVIETKRGTRLVQQGRKFRSVRVIECEWVATIPLPPHARPVRDAMAWHAEHQAQHAAMAA